MDEAKLTEASVALKQKLDALDIEAKAEPAQAIIDIKKLIEGFSTTGSKKKIYYALLAASIVLVLVLLYLFLSRRLKKGTTGEDADDQLATSDRAVSKVNRDSAI